MPHSLTASLSPHLMFRSLETAAGPLLGLIKQGFRHLESLLAQHHEATLRHVARFQRAADVVLRAEERLEELEVGEIGAFLVQPQGKKRKMTYIYNGYTSSII